MKRNIAILIITVLYLEHLVLYWWWNHDNLTYIQLFKKFLWNWISIVVTSIAFAMFIKSF
jgi:hypothetical protein